MIKLQAIGNLGKDCVLNNVNGKSVINFSIAHTERFRDSTGNQKDRTIWVECAYWTDRTGIAPYLKRGTQVFVEGNPDVRTYQTQDGRQGASLSLRVTSIQLLGAKAEGSGGEGGGGASYGAPAGNSNSYGGGNSNSYNAPAPSGGAGDMTEPLDDLPF
jgi:single-strand DNA-binding protein